MGALTKADISFSIVGNDESAKAVNNFKKNVKGAGNALSGLRNAIMAAFSAREIIEAANVMIGVENRMNALTGSASETAVAMNNMRRIAADSRSDFDAVAMLYTRLSLATEHLGATQRDVADATQTVANTFIIAGSHAQEANNSARQLAQGLASGALRGDELRSVMENNTILTKMLADGLGMTIGELREFGHAGKLTAETVMPILIAGTKKTNEEINKMPMTLGQAGVALRNNFQFMVGDIQEATEGFSKVAQVIGFFAQNIDALFIPAVIAAAFAFKAFTAAVMANPFGLILTAVTTAIMAIYMFRNELTDIFNNFIYKTLPIFALNFEKIFKKLHRVVDKVLVTPVKFLLTSMINQIFTNFNTAFGLINSLVDKLPKRIKDKLGEIPEIPLLPDPKGNLKKIDKDIEEIDKKIQEATDKVIAKSDRRSITEFVFGERNEDQGSDETGFRQLTSLEKFLKAAEDGYSKFYQGIKSMQDEMQNVFKKSYDGMTKLTMDFLETGKANFKDFATSIVRELIRIAVQKLVIDKMFTSFGSILGKTRDKVSANMDYDALTDGDTLFDSSYEGGGFTGKGSRAGGLDGRGGFAAILHPNETVIDHTKAQPRQAQQAAPTVNFNISTVDAAGFDQLLTSRKGLITQIINNAMNTQGKMGIV
jgi:tape measure domain-containing protein